MSRTSSRSSSTPTTAAPGPKNQTEFSKKKTRTYDQWPTTPRNSGRLTTSIADREDTETHRVNARYYRYDDAGNITILSDVPDGDATQTDRQCFTYDAQGQLTEAWTSANTGCLAPGKTHRAPTYTDSTGAVTATNVTAANDGYWQTYTYDSLGNREKLVEHDVNVTVISGAVVTTGDVTTDYEYGIDPSGSGVLKQPHTLTGITSDSASIDTDADLSYDASGNTDTRTYGGDTQNIDWTWDGKVASVSGFGADGDGQVVGLVGKCLDLSATNAAVQLFSCTGKKAQRFQLDPASAADTTTGALKILDQCVIPTSGGTANGTTITVAACTGLANQRWTTTADGTLKHVSSGKCLDVPSSNSADGTDLQLYTCSSSSAQKWSFADETKYIYDASGNRLISSTAGSHTLYLDDTELTTDANGDVSYCQRYYTQSGAPTVMRHSQRGSSTTSLTAIVTDHHGTAIANVSLASGQTVQKQKTDPFGVDRGTESSTWLSHRGYLGGTDDNQTDLTHLGAREYDPTTGRFISADPIIDLADPLQMNGYAYSNNSPVSKSDPTGLQYAADDYNPAPAPAPTGTCPSTVNTNCPEYGSGITTVTVTKTVTVTTPSSDCDWWCKTKGWMQEHVEVITFVTEITVGVACGVGVAAAGTLTGGVALAAAAGCGALAGAASSLVGNAIDPDADHSVGGYLKAGVTGAAIGAASGALGFGAGKGAVKLAKKLLSPCKKHSFLPGTGVLLADGTYKAIEDIEVGDVITTTDTDTGETVKKKVVSTITTEDDKAFTELTIATEGGTSSLVATDHHPFWVPELNEWIEAGDLQPGQWLRTSTGIHVQITAVAHYTQRQRTHDLTIESVHAYYVAAGATPVLVHNCGGAVTGHPSTCDCANGGVPKVRNGKHAGGVHPKTNVPFDANGFPDFSAWRHPTVPDVRIQLTGSRSKDFRTANQAAGLSSTPAGYTWHHHQDRGLMQLINRQVHADTGHTGGF